MRENLLSSGLELLPQRREGVGCVQVYVDEVTDLCLVGVVTTDGAGVDFGERVVERAAVTQCLMERCVETVQDAQLELVRTLKEVFDIGERKHDVRYALARCGCQALACG